MKGYIGLANRNLIRNKKNSLVCIIGIMLGTVIMLTTNIIYNSEMIIASEKLKKTTGLYDVIFQNINKEQLNKLKGHQMVDTAAVFKEIGVSEIKTKGIDQYYNLLGLDDKSYNKIFDFDIIAGRKPENMNEIMIDNSAACNIDGRVRVGDNIEIKVFLGQSLNNKNIRDQLIKENSTIEFMRENSVGLPGIEKEDTRTYKVVGIFQSSEEYKDMANNIFTKLTDEDINEMIKMNVFVLLEFSGVYEENLRVNDFYINYLENDIKNISQGYSNNNFFYSTKNYNKSIKNLEPIIVIVIIAIFEFGVIYNAFNISIGERYKQFGILRAMGATKIQLGKLVFYEAFILYILGLILGFILGIVNTKVVLAIFAKIFGLDFSYINVSLYASNFIIIAIIIFFIVMITVYKALFKDINLSPIQNISGLSLLNSVKVNEIKISKKISKIFNVEGELSYKNLSRNKKRNRICLRAIVVSMILVMFFFCQLSFYKVETASIVPSSNWDVKYSSVNRQFLDEDISYLKNINGVDGLYIDKKFSLNIPIEKNKLDSYLISSFKSYSEMSKSNEKYYNGYYGVKTLFRAADENTLDLYKDNLIEGELNYNKLKDDGIIIVNSGTTAFPRIINKQIQFEIYDIKKILDVKVGDKILIPLEKKANKEINIKNYFKNEKLDKTKFKEFTIIGIVNEDALKNKVNNRIIENLTEDVTFITSKESFKKINNDSNDELVIKTNKDKNRSETIKAIRDYSTIKYDNYTDFYSKMIDYKNTSNRTLCFDINFEINILIIVILNIINTFNANILLRKKELGALRAIGTTKKQLNKMLLLENVFLVILSVCFGLIFGAFPAYLSQLSMNNKDKNMYIILITITFLTSIFLIIICILTTIYQLKKLKDLSIVDNIRNEE
ncbi:MacB-like core domain-containing protein [Clostridium cavendishii DSM 21758]|uniref:MacB-like core domain-containing protein n=1 Tax=Clostridium cavendishii DSM 21758 TaxID=1121302 RepID=A0A1M6I7Z9_9CLOT|nr:ABC transporter permease [Clostridium cavendishii]SHJ30535.1 MacB-like core domain-containing protein [Clostridium cavendishii DSM 21758]